MRRARGACSGLARKAANQNEVNTEPGAARPLRSSGHAHKNFFVLILANLEENSERENRDQKLQD